MQAEAWREAQAEARFAGGVRSRRRSSVIIGGVLGAIVADQAYIQVMGPREDPVRNLLPEFTGMSIWMKKGLATASVNRLGIDLTVCFSSSKS